MRKFLRFAVVLALMAAVMLATAVMGADVVPVADATSGVVQWFTLNNVYVLAVALALSELLGVIPALKGNGILDAIIKGLRMLATPRVR